MTQSIQVLDYLISQTYQEKRSKRVKSSKIYKKSIKIHRNLKFKDFTEEYPRKWPNLGHKKRDCAGLRALGQSKLNLKGNDCDKLKTLICLCIRTLQPRNR